MPLSSCPGPSKRHIFIDISIKWGRSPSRDAAKAGWRHGFRFWVVSNVVPEFYKTERVRSGADKRVGEAAKNAGVQRYALFHNARYQGLYGADKRSVDRAKGLRDGENLFDRAGALELSAHDFQMQLAATKIVNESINGEQNAIAANLEVAQQVRKTVIDQAGIAPEALPLESEPIKEVKKRLTKQAQLPRPR